MRAAVALLAANHVFASNTNANDNGTAGVTHGDGSGDQIARPGGGGNGNTIARLDAGPNGAAFTPTTGSPAIDHGTVPASTAEYGVDCDGTMIHLGTAPEIGAIESQ